RRLPSPIELHRVEVGSNGTGAALPVGANNKRTPAACRCGREDDKGPGPNGFRAFIAYGAACESVYSFATARFVKIVSRSPIRIELPWIWFQDFIEATLVRNSFAIETSVSPRFTR